MGAVNRQVIKLNHPFARKRAMEAIYSAPEGYVVEVREQSKSRDQENKYHAMIGDIAKQVLFMDRKWSDKDWKRLIVDLFAKVMRTEGTPLRQEEYGRIVPSLDGDGIVQLGIQTSNFTKSEASNFIEFLYFYGAENNVQWSEERFDKNYLNWLQSIQPRSNNETLHLRHGDDSSGNGERPGRCKDGSHEPVTFDNERQFIDCPE